MVFSEKQWVFTYADIEKLTGKTHQSTRHHYSRGYFGETLRSLVVYLSRYAEPDLKAEMLLELTNSVDITQLTKKRQNYLAKRREMAAKRRETDQKVVPNLSDDAIRIGKVLDKHPEHIDTVEMFLQTLAKASKKKA